MVRDWAARVDASLKSDASRPSALLAIANPYGGAWKALKVWREVAAPIMDQAGVPSEQRQAFKNVPCMVQSMVQQ